METAPDLYLGHANGKETKLHEKRITKVGQTINDTKKDTS